MREADRRCIEELGIPGAVLMNNAGAAVYRELPPGAVGIVCGKGNNGGDGFVVARFVLLDRRPVRVVHVGDPKDIKGDAKLYCEVFQRLGGTVESVEGDAVAGAVAALAECDVLVDAMLGTGVKGEVRGDIRTAIDHWPDVPTVAVDIPSGINGDDGSVGGNAIRAAKTVTLQYAKKGFEMDKAQDYLGDVVVADIGIPDVCADDAAWAALRESS